jgi:hypothetical protein
MSERSSRLQTGGARAVAELGERIRQRPCNEHHIEDCCVCRGLGRDDNPRSLNGRRGPFDFR